MDPRQVKVTCCVAGGGPAGMMLGLLLARAGVNVLVLEKHADFFRDFRGDTVHPSTLEVMYELGYLDEFLKLPHDKLTRLVGQFGETPIAIADLSHLPAQCRFIALMPQWDFLNFLAKEAARYPNFSLMTQAEATGLIERDGRVAGLTVRTPDGPLDVAADLVVAADGRSSILREKSGLESVDFGAPMDALWFRLSRRPDDKDQPLGHFDAGRVFVMLNRGDYWQCAYVVAKGSFDAIRARGIQEFRDDIAKLTGFTQDRLDEIASWDDVKLLVVQVNRLERWWKPGFLCIGDAAHAMSPIGGVGVNLAVQDAVAAANVIAKPLKDGRLKTAHLAAVEKRRAWPTRATQSIQLGMQNAIIAPTLAAKATIRPPLALRILTSIPLFQRFIARTLGLGVRPEHVAAFIRDGGARRQHAGIEHGT